jgi:hypothetical protein
VSTADGTPERRPPVWELEAARTQAGLANAGQLRRSWLYVSLLAIWVLGGWLLVRPGWSSGIRGAVMRMVLFVCRYVLTWGLVALLVSLISPTLLVGSVAGLETALGVLPAIIVAVLVLLLGSVAVLAQMASSTWGSRAPLVLTLDERLQQAILRPLLLLIAVLLLAGQVPDPPIEPSSAVTSIVAALLLATVWMTVRATVLPVLVIQTLAPRAFPQLVLQPVGRELSDGSTGFVVLRGPMLGEMLRVSLRREDSISVQATLEAIVRFQGQYLLALHENDDIRTHVDEAEGLERTSWLAHDLTIALINAGEQALRDIADSDDTNAISNTLAALAYSFVEAEQYGDAMLTVDGLINLGTSAHQLTPQSAYGINFHGPPLENLAAIEARLEDATELPDYVGDVPVDAYTLAGWGLVGAYPKFQFGADQHPLWLPAIARLGESPPWEEAIELVQDQAWIALWGNKQHLGPEPVLDVLQQAQLDHASMSSA